MPQDPPANSPYKPLTLDIEKYRHGLDGHGLTTDQKDEYLKALWLMVASFADLNLPPLFEDSCGQPTAGTDAVPDARAAMLYSTHSKTARGFAAAANVATPPRQGKEVL